MRAGWQDFWLDLTAFVATKSKDRSRQVGCVIVDDRQVLVAIGWNGFARGVDDTIEARHERPAKYLWTEHAERNAIYNAAAKGVSTLGCSMYLTWSPCCDCARGIIQAGIGRVVVVKSTDDDAKWGADMALAVDMMIESGITVEYVANRVAPVSAA